MLQEDHRNAKDEIRLVRKERDELRAMKDLNIQEAPSSSSSCTTCVQFLKEKADLLMQRDSAEQLLIKD